MWGLHNKIAASRHLVSERDLAVLGEGSGLALVGESWGTLAGRYWRTP